MDMFNIETILKSNFPSISTVHYNVKNVRVDMGKLQNRTQSQQCNNAIV